VNATSQYVQSGSVNPVDVVYAALAGALGTQGGFVWNVGVNAATGAEATETNNAVAGKPLFQGTLTGAMVNAGAAAIGYGAGLAAQSILPGINWFIPNNLPTIGAGLFGSAGSEAGTVAINYTKGQVGK
jgi:filamentous hemagglutinin